MKIVYLDIDGVLNNHEFQDSLQEYPETRDREIFSRQWWLDMIDPNRVSILNLLSNEADFVLSTTWRMRHTDQEMQSLLNDAGFTGSIIGHTSKKTSSKRGPEIEHDIEERKPTHIVVLDDLDLSSWEFAPYWVQTDGLTESDAKKALGILQESRRPFQRELERELQDAEEGFVNGWTVRRCYKCQKWAYGGPTLCETCSGE